MDDQRRRDQGMTVRRPCSATSTSTGRPAPPQVAVYAGVPAANRAFRVAQQALEDPGPPWIGA